MYGGVVKETMHELVQEYLVNQAFEEWLRDMLAPFLAEIADESLTEMHLDSAAETLLEEVVAEEARGVAREAHVRVCVCRNITCVLWVAMR
jgi:hypothetical protein